MSKINKNLKQDFEKAVDENLESLVGVVKHNPNILI